MVDQRFYYEFEQRFRGSREEIEKRLEVYAPLLRSIEESGLPMDAVDYGCGRGEWLKLLLRRGWNAVGVDSNSSMLEPAEAEGLKVLVGDAMAHIESLADNSLSLVTGFHIVEHLPSHILHKLLAETYRVLRPGGIAIFETPNPENFLVGSNRFYLDPTHVHPIPPYYLNFLADFSGFEEAACIGVNAPELSFNSGAAGAFLEFSELFPDYALVARKQTAASTAEPLSSVVDREFKANTPYSHSYRARFINEIRGLELEVGNLRKNIDDLNSRFARLENLEVRRNSKGFRGAFRRLKSIFRH